MEFILQSDEENSVETHYKIIVLGSGPAGYTAAIYAARAELKPLIITGPQKGGQLTTTTEIENFPGFANGIDGNQLMLEMEQQAARFGAKSVYGQVSRVELSERPFKIFVEDKQYTCDALIIATGATARYLGLESEKKYISRGVSACATCDGYFYKGKKVAVVGGGDAALEEAGYLTNFCEKVFLVHRRNEFRGSKAMQERVLNNEKIEVVWDSVVEEVVGDETGMTDLKVRNVKTGEIRSLGTPGMFVAIGHTPNTSLFEGILDMDEKKYLITKDRSTRTNIEGVFVAGDVADSVYRQAITAAGAGCKAAIDAERWLAEQ